jgi:catechol 2,3-dioxygenase-like lactoylglutathione lyase family enzyme
MPKPVLDQVNLVAADLDATLAFYRRLGFEVTDPPSWPAGSDAKHASVQMPDGFRVEFDNLPMARVWDAGSRRPDARRDTVLGVTLETRDAVDGQTDALRAAGSRVRQEPYDAFWGARYAIVEDPDGRLVGLMSPIDPARKYTPET